MLYCADTNIIFLFNSCKIILKFAKDPAEAAAQAVKAGTDLEWIRLQKPYDCY